MSSQSRAAAIQLKMTGNDVFTVPFQGRYIDVPQIRVSTETLIYRINNGRTRVQQLQRIADDSLPADFFTGKQESQSAQDMQHQILLAMSKDSKADVYSELQNSKQQREPLVITRNGVVVNGNRRLAAIKDIYSKQKPGAEFPNFAFADVAVLPDGATEQDIEDVETEYQELPETRLSYGWIERRLKMRYQLDTLKVKPETLRAKYHLRAVEDVNRELQQLSLVEDYLAFIGKPTSNYWEVSRSEEIFKRLQQALAKSSPDKLELRRLVAFNLIKMGGSLDDRVYKFHQVFGNDLDKVSQRFLKESSTTLADNMKSKEAATGPKQSDDPLDGLTSSTPTAADILVTQLKLPDAGNSVKRLVEIYENIKKEEAAGDIRRLAFTKSQDANRLLCEIDLGTVDPSTKDGLISQLDSILKLAAALRAQLL